MKVFTDLHHGDLFYSLHLLFEKRLSWDLYRPIGLDWFENSFWKIGDPYPNPKDTALQYLNIGNDDWDQYKNLNGNLTKENEVFYIKEPYHNYFQKAITLKTFKEMKFDLIIPSYPAHDICYEKLQKLYQPQAKIIMQMGNIGQQTHLPNVMHSVPYNAKTNQKTIYYHQEISPTLYSYVSPNPQTKNIYSFVNNLPYKNIYEQYKKSLPEINMKAYGGGCPDGSVYGAKGVGEKMKEANIGWHLKDQNGFGHNTMGWYASGRPTIIQIKDFHGYPYKDIWYLCEPNVTCIALDQSDFNTNHSKIHKALDPENNLKMCEKAFQRFNEVVNYNQEAEQLKQFLSNIL